jgi:hypothetical protein
VTKPETSNDVDNSGWLGLINAASQETGTTHQNIRFYQEAISAARKVMQHVGAQEPTFSWLRGEPIEGVGDRWYAYRYGTAVEHITSLPILLGTVENGAVESQHSFAIIEETRSGSFTLPSVISGKMKLNEAKLRKTLSDSIFIKHMIGNEAGENLTQRPNPRIDNYLSTAVDVYPGDTLPGFHRTISIVADAAGLQLKPEPLKYSYALDQP